MSLFIFGTVPNGGQRTHGARVSCGHCGAVRTVPVNRFKNTHPGRDGQLEEQFVQRKLEADGWLIGKKPSAHRCAGCYSAIKAAAKRKSEVTKMDNRSATVVELSPAKEMSRDDRRVIFEKLNEVYVDEKTGYSSDWTDAKVAVDLGITRAWVSTVREEMFGPEKSNAGIKQAIADAKACLDECKKLMEPLAPLMARTDKIEKTLAEINKSLR